MTELSGSTTPARWSAQRKAQVAGAVSKGEISLQHACETYALTEEELISWQDTMERHGVAGLRVSAPERRKSDRRRVREPASVVFSGCSQRACTITDISTGGARLKFGAAVRPPHDFVLTCTRTGRSSWVNLVWLDSREAGVRFIPSPSVPATEQWPSGEWLMGAD